MAAVCGAVGMKAVWPLLMVRDMDRSVRFYRDGLGFDLVGEARGDDGKVFWCRVAREGASVMLQQAEDGSEVGGGVSLYVICVDVDALYAEWKGRGVAVGRPTVAPYGMKQLRVPEPDGYELWFESEVDSGGKGEDDGGETE